MLSNVISLKYFIIFKKKNKKEYRKYIKYLTYD